MTANDYHFVTHWRVLGTADEVSEILERAEDLPRWWPSVYLDVKEIEPGDAGGIGKIVSLYTKGWLPYARGCITADKNIALRFPFAYYVVRLRLRFWG